MTPAFVGAWTVARTITDLERTMPLVCSGSATLRHADDALAYSEAVSFSLDGRVIHATRAYRFASTGATIFARFENGTPFFTLELDADGSGYATHRCGDDVYELTLRLRAPDTWQTRWTVTGTKHLSIITRYSHER